MSVSQVASYKLRQLFSDKVVNKRLARLKEVSRLPRYIGEYLVTKFCSEEPTEEELAKLDEFISRHHPDPKDKDKILHDLMTRGSATLIDEVKVETDIKSGTHKAQIPCVRITDAQIDERLLEKYENLLRSGMWGLVRLEYRALRSGEGVAVVVNFEPFQVSNVDLDEFIEGRHEFTTDEWVCVLINTLGLNPEVYDRRSRMLLLLRLVPLVEANSNMFELGPRATGKTYLYRNISYYTRIFSGGKVSPAVLFYHGLHRTIGEVGIRDCIVFDEISKINFSEPDEMMGKLKDYMVDGFFERGILKRAHSTCSLVFMGNIEVSGRAPAESLSDILPPFMRDSAFIDRIHGLIPGWELPKIMKSRLHLSNDYGFASDYFAEIMHELRKRDYGRFVDEHVEFEGPTTIRDERGIRKVASGLLKLLYPHGEFTRSELQEVMELAVEVRQRVADWLHELSPGEFPKKKLGFRIWG